MVLKAAKGKSEKSGDAVMIEVKGGRSEVNDSDLVDADDTADGYSR